MRRKTPLKASRRLLQSRLTLLTSSQVGADGLGPARPHEGRQKVQILDVLGCHDTKFAVGGYLPILR